MCAKRKILAGGRQKLRDVNDMTAKLLLVLFMFLPISISCKENLVKICLRKTETRSF